ncbi:MAG: helix-turn-helix domain-containing protein [Candidatus Woesearchaeota archaeon]
MPSCELCGRNPAVFDCEVEGTMMRVCQDCSRFGKVKGKSNVKIVFQETKKSLPKEQEYLFVQGYGSIVKNARERLGLKQEDFAKKINEHKSLIHQVESEHIKPSIIFAKKLERALHIKIVEEVKSEPVAEEELHPMMPKKDSKENNFRSKSGPLTLGDLMDKKR